MATRSVTTPVNQPGRDDDAAAESTLVFIERRHVNFDLESDFAMFASDAMISAEMEKLQDYKNIPDAVYNDVFDNPESYEAAWQQKK